MSRIVRNPDKMFWKSRRKITNFGANLLTIVKNLENKVCRIMQRFESAYVEFVIVQTCAKLVNVEEELVNCAKWVLSVSAKIKCTPTYWKWKFLKICNYNWILQKSKFLKMNFVKNVKIVPYSYDVFHFNIFSTSNNVNNVNNVKF